MTHRPLPHAQDAEKAILGALLLSPVHAGAVIRGALCGTEFWDSRHQIVYGVIAKMLDAGQTVDLLTVTERFRTTGKLDEVGGASYLSDLIGACPSTTHVEPYIEIVQEKALRRELIGMGFKLQEQAYDESQEIESIHAEACSGILGATQGRTRIQEASDGIRQGLERYEAALASERRLLGLSTGFDDLDYLTRGLESGNTYYIAGRPSSGKSALMMAIVMHIAEFENAAVGVLSLEMAADALCMRAVAARAGVNVRHPKELTPENHEAVVKAAMEIKALPFYVDDRSGLRLGQVRATCRQMKARYGCRMFCLDHLHLTGAEPKQRTYDHLRAFTAGLHDLAKELDAPFVVLAQLNRDVEKDERLPRVSDLKESGSAEQDADCVMLLSPVTKEQRENLPKRLKELPERELELLMRVNLAKQREGACGYFTNVYLAFEKWCTRYRDIQFPSRQETLDVREPQPTADQMQPH